MDLLAFGLFSTRKRVINKNLCVPQLQECHVISVTSLAHLSNIEKVELNFHELQCKVQIEVNG